MTVFSEQSLYVEHVLELGTFLYIHYLIWGPQGNYCCSYFIDKDTGA